MQKHQSGKGSRGTDMDGDGGAFPGRGDRKLLRQDNLGRDVKKGGGATQGKESRQREQHPQWL